MKNKEFEKLKLADQLTIVISKVMGKDFLDFKILSKEETQNQMENFFNSVYDFIIPRLKVWEKLLAYIWHGFDSFILKDYHIKLDKENRCVVYYKDEKIGMTKFLYKKGNK